MTTIENQFMTSVISLLSRLLVVGNLTGILSYQIVSRIALEFVFTT
ncbi:hypothetical protein H1P_1920008 [Hyella patelloides LEGE 07179]|uniref:Uncharacterized protein n=1 Tax=Hyella patelloides LEGE 07179 TaxID=945734 RepID=A0A563VPU0_9CYAN|nr:hypothetical protein H1P_1920008 [Hyella patelloides LEGE 07179]